MDFPGTGDRGENGVLACGALRGTTRFRRVLAEARPRWGNRLGHGARCPPFRGDAPVLVLPGPVAGANRLGLPQGAGLGRKIKRRRGRRLSGGRAHRLGQRLRGDFHRDRVRGSHHLPIAHTRLFRLLLPINAWSFHFQFPGGFLCLSLRNRSETAGINHRATGDSSVSFWKKTPEGQDFF